MTYLFHLLAGGVLALGFAPFNLWGPALLALLYFCHSLLTGTRLARKSYCFGLGLFAAGIHWIYLSLYHYGGASLFFAIATNTVLVLVFALFIGAVGWGLERFTQTPGQRALLLPALWLALEYGRAHFLSGFPWLALGYVPSPLRELAPLGGVWLVGWATLTVCTLLAWAGQQKSQRAALAAGLLALGGWACRWLSFTTPVGPPLTVALVQGNIDQLQKFEPSRMRAHMELYIQMLLARKEEVIILPETAITHFESTITDILTPLGDILRLRNQALITGIPAGDLDRDIYYNAVIVLGAGNGRYYKHHLLPFGEYLPARGLFEFFRDYVQIPLGDFTRGAATQPPLFSRGVPLSASICYEAAFGRDIRRNAGAAHYLVNISNDGWFKGSIAYDQHLQMNQLRALESGRPLARATNTGLTAFIDERGHIVAQLERDTRGVLSGTVQPREGLTPYVRWGNRVFEALLLVQLLVFLGCRFRKVERSPVG